MGYIILIVVVGILAIIIYKNNKESADTLIDSVEADTKKVTSDIKSDKI